MMDKDKAKEFAKKHRWRLIIAAPFILFFLLQLYFFAHIIWWNFANPSSTSFMRAQLSELQKENPNARLKYQWVPYDKISRNFKRAVVASEDANFTEHDGVDWDALKKAFEKNKRKGKVVAGGSTITQQLAKNLFLSGSRSYLRKGQELIITYMLELIMSKERVFEIYLNVIEMGKGVFGVEAAAQHYFKIHASQLSPYQAAKLAVLLPRPRVYGKNLGSNYIVRRTNIILRRMGVADIPK